MTVIAEAAMSKSGQYWAAVSRRGEVWMWAGAGRTLQRVWQAHSTSAFALAFSPDGCALASASHDGSVKLWEVERGYLSPRQGALLWAGWHTGGIHAAAAAGGTPGAVRSVAWSPDGRWLASGSGGQGQGEGGELFVWEAYSGQRVQSLVKHPGVVFAVAWSPRRERLISGGSDGMLRWWGVDSGECVGAKGPSGNGARAQGEPR